MQGDVQFIIIIVVKDSVFIWGKADNVKYEFVVVPEFMAFNARYHNNDFN